MAVVSHAVDKWVRPRLGDFYPHVNLASLPNRPLYPHIRVRDLALNWPIFIRIDLRHFAKILRFLSELRSDSSVDFQGSWNNAPSAKTLLKEGGIRVGLEYCVQLETDRYWPLTAADRRTKAATLINQERVKENWLYLLLVLVVVLVVLDIDFQLELAGPGASDSGRWPFIIRCRSMPMYDGRLE